MLEERKADRKNRIGEFFTRLNVAVYKCYYKMPLIEEMSRIRRRTEMRSFLSRLGIIMREQYQIR